MVSRESHCETVMRCVFAVNIDRITIDDFELGFYLQKLKTSAAIK